MHSIAVILGGLILLTAAVGLTRITGRDFRCTLPWFVLVWLICAAVNMWIGVSHAGYGVAQESPIFLVIFALPALAAILVARRW